MGFLIACLVFGSRFIVHIVCKFLKKRMSPWVWLGYTILDILMAVPVLLLVLFISLIDAITNDFNLGIDIMGMAGGYALLWTVLFVYFLVAMISLVMMIKSFKDRRLDKEKEEEHLVAQILEEKK